MSKVFVNIGFSLDGYMAPEGMTMGKPEYKNWGAKWGALMAWILNQQYFRENLKLGPGGETGPVNDLLRSTTERIGANVMDKRMFDQGEVAWPNERPGHDEAADRLSSGCNVVRRPLVALFAIKWLPRAPRQALCILALQAGATLAALAPVFFLKL